MYLPASLSFKSHHLHSILFVSLTGRYGLPEEVAGLVKFLALDPEAAYITGQVCPAALVKFHTNYTEYVALQGFGGVSSNQRL